MAELIFGDFVFDTRRLAVVGPGGEVPLRPRAREVLFYLLANRHRFVPRSELAQAVWHERVASPATINQTVSEVRRALGDSPGSPAYIETRSKAGYRFVASVVHQPTATVEAHRPQKAPRGSPLHRRPGYRTAVAVGGTLLTLAVLGIVLAGRGVSPVLVVAPPVAEDDERSTATLAGTLAREVKVALATRWFPVIAADGAAATSKGLVLSIRCRSVHALRVEVTATLTRIGRGEEVWRGNWVAPPDEGALAALAREVAAAAGSAADARLTSP